LCAGRVDQALRTFNKKDVGNVGGSAGKRISEEEGGFSL